MQPRINPIFDPTLEGIFNEVGDLIAYLNKQPKSEATRHTIKSLENMQIDLLGVKAKLMNVMEASE